MQVVPNYKGISVFEKKCLEEKNKTEHKTEINTADVKKIISASAVSFCTGKFDNGNIDYEIKTSFYLCYENNDGQIKKYEGCQESSGKIAVEGEYTKTVCSCHVEKVESDSSGIKLSLTAFSVIKFKLFAVCEKNILTGGENVICDKAEFAYKKDFGVNCGVFSVEEECVYSVLPEEVIFQHAEPVLTACQCGVGTVILDGELRVYQILLQKGEKKDIIRIDKVFPFRTEVEYEDAMPSFDCTAKISLKSFKTDISADEDKNKSTVLCSAVICYEAVVYSTETEECVSDAFSLDNNLELKSTTFSTTEDLPMCCISQEKPLSVEISDVDGVCCLFNERVEIVSQNFTDKLNQDCILHFSAICKKEEEFVTKKFEIPFETALTVDFDKTCNYESFLTAEISSFEFKDSVITLNAKTFCCVYPQKTTSHTMACDVLSVGEKQKNGSAISVYIALEGETLWSLSKRLNESPENLAQMNKDLQFPLSGNERIVVYRQK